MNYNSEEKTLRIDLSKEKYDPAMLLQYEDVKKIQIDEYNDLIELPAEIHKLETLYISVADSKEIYPPPVNLDKLVHLKDLTLWSDFGIENLAPMPNLERFSTIIKSTVRIKTISEKFSNLKSLELWSRTPPDEAIPSEIGNLPSLEYLEFVNFSFSELPTEITNLKSLKKLKIKGGGNVIKFPEVICNLTWLEALYFGNEITTLPAQFINLQSLKKLHFEYAFNKGIYRPIDRWEPNKKIYLDPIPEIIGKLPLLEELNLTRCGVVNLDFLKNAGQLKRLYIGHSGLKNLDDLSVLKNLEKLSLRTSEILQDLSGIADLPIKKLNIESCEMESIEIINRLPLLEELNIKGCSNIQDLSPIYNHPTLKVLEADDTVMEQWNLRDHIKNAPSLESVLHDIKSGNIQLFQEAVSNLKLHVDINSSRDFNPLASFFGEEPDNSAMVHLESFENAFMQFKTDLTIDTLITLVDISLHSVIEDNYYISVLAIEEICNRKDATAQKKVIKFFHKACEYYDFGHRMQDDTVLDKLYDDLFPDFETEALINLLKDAHSDMMNCRGGDCADRCFIPAFEKVKDEKQFSELIQIFFEYEKTHIQYWGNTYFTKLHHEILGVLAGNHAEKFQDKIAEEDGSNRFYTLLKSDNLNDYLTLIDSLETGDPKLFEEKNFEIIKKIIKTFTVSFETAYYIIGFYIEKEACREEVKETILKYFTEKGFPYMLDYLKTKAINHARFVERIILIFIRDFIKNAIPLAQMDPFYEYLVSTGHHDKNNLYKQGLMMLLDEINEHKGKGEMEKQDVLLVERVEEITSQVQGTLNLGALDDFYYKLKMMPDSGVKWEFIKRICLAIFPIIPQTQILLCLHVAVIASIKTDDQKAFNAIKKYTPEKTTDHLLSYNLASAFAHFGEKEPMLFWVKQSLLLGKTKQQFLDDPDFLPYLKDKDFMEALSGK